MAGVAGTFYHACAWTPNGTVICFGDNNAGQLGNGGTNPTSDSWSLPPVVGLSGGECKIALSAQNAYSLLSCISDQCDLH